MDNTFAHRLLATARGDQSGATLIEYALVAMLIATVIAGSVSVLGVDVSGLISVAVSAFP
jgi:Flp pilus assembly pilin Flp